MSIRVKNFLSRHPVSVLFWRALGSVRKEGKTCSGHCHEHNAPPALKSKRRRINTGIITALGEEGRRRFSKGTHWFSPEKRERRKKVKIALWMDGEWSVPGELFPALCFFSANTCLPDLWWGARERWKHDRNSTEILSGKYNFINTVYWYRIRFYSYDSYCNFWWIFVLGTVQATRCICHLPECPGEKGESVNVGHIFSGQEKVWQMI